MRGLLFLASTLLGIISAHADKKTVGISGTSLRIFELNLADSTPQSDILQFTEVSKDTQKRRYVYSLSYKDPQNSSARIVEQIEIVKKSPVVLISAPPPANGQKAFSYAISVLDTAGKVRSVTDCEGKQCTTVTAKVCQNLIAPLNWNSDMNSIIGKLQTVDEARWKAAFETERADLKGLAEQARGYLKESLIRQDFPSNQTGVWSNFTGGNAIVDLDQLEAFPKNSEFKRACQAIIASNTTTNPYRSLDKGSGGEPLMNPKSSPTSKDPLPKGEAVP